MMVMRFAVEFVAPKEKAVVGARLTTMSSGHEQQAITTLWRANLNSQARTVGRSRADAPAQQKSD